nr:MAG TPA: hypothetical protein [Caudoviricetes sp.]
MCNKIPSELNSGGIFLFQKYTENSVDNTPKMVYCIVVTKKST